MRDRHFPQVSQTQPGEVQWSLASRMEWVQAGHASKGASRFEGVIYLLTRYVRDATCPGVLSIRGIAGICTLVFRL